MNLLESESSVKAVVHPTRKSKKKQNSDSNRIGKKKKTKTGSKAGKIANIIIVTSESLDHRTSETNDSSISVGLKRKSGDEIDIACEEPSPTKKVAVIPAEEVDTIIPIPLATSQLGAKNMTIGDVMPSTAFLDGSVDGAVSSAPISGAVAVKMEVLREDEQKLTEEDLMHSTMDNNDTTEEQHNSRIATTEAKPQESCNVVNNEDITEIDIGTLSSSVAAADMAEIRRGIHGCSF